MLMMNLPVLPPCSQPSSRAQRSDQSFKQMESLPSRSSKRVGILLLTEPQRHARNLKTSRHPSSSSTYFTLTREAPNAINEWRDVDRTNVASRRRWTFVTLTSLAWTTCNRPTTPPGPSLLGLHSLKQRLSQTLQCHVKGQRASIDTVIAMC